MGKRKVNLGGRPTVMTKSVLDKLQQAFALGCTDTEACLYADIHISTLYLYQDKHPEFIYRKEELKLTPILAARTRVVKGVTENYGNAMDYLKRKKKLEFGDRVDVTSNDEKFDIVKITINQPNAKGTHNQSDS